MLSFLMFAAAVAAPAPAAITTKDPDVFIRQLTEMGYAPDTIDKKGNIVSMVAHLAKGGLVIVMGGCTANKDCAYAVLVGSFTDVKSAPPEWIAKMNDDYDLIKVGKNDEGMLTYSSGAIVEGMPRASFRKWIELVDQSSDDLGQEAIKAGLTK
jgi:hypothetical protein